MRTEDYFDSRGKGKVHYCCWMPEGAPKAVLQIVHGIAEHILRYDDFACWLNSRGIAVVAEDHMGHGKTMETGTVGYFNGGWFTAAEDTVHLYRLTKARFPELPYVILGHSMGSFLTRSILIRHPELNIDGAIICGTGWIEGPVLSVGKNTAKLICGTRGCCCQDKTLQKIMFGSYNRKVEHPRTEFDWLCRDNRVVDAYIGDPMCGFIASAGLVRDMLGGMQFNQKMKNLQQMRKDLPVFFIAGEADPVGSYGKGVTHTAEMFRKAGMRQVSTRLYPLCRHEILNEINHMEVYEDIFHWMEKTVF